MPEKTPTEVAHQLILDGLRALTTRVEALDQRLTDHMEHEERIKREVDAKLAALTDLVRAMPHKDGEPDLFGHRNDHEDWRELAAHSNHLKWNLREKALEWLIIGLIVLLATGKFSEIVATVFAK